jgi:hypothetical protein
MQIKTQFFAKIFGHVKKKQYFCSRKSRFRTGTSYLKRVKTNHYGRLSRGECNKYMPRNFWGSIF